MKEAVALAWAKVAPPHVLKEVNWAGRIRQDRTPKMGIDKTKIAEFMLGNLKYSE